MTSIVRRRVIIAGATLLVAACIIYGAIRLPADRFEVLFDGEQWDWTTTDGASSAWIVHGDGSIEASGADGAGRGGCEPAE